MMTEPQARAQARQVLLDDANDLALFLDRHSECSRAVLQAIRTEIKRLRDIAAILEGA